MKYSAIHAQLFFKYLAGMRGKIKITDYPSELTQGLNVANLLLFLFQNIRKLNTAKKMSKVIILSNEN